jgi:cell wall-associated NlpC family hydrolase
VFRHRISRVLLAGLAAALSGILLQAPAVGAKPTQPSDAQLDAARQKVHERAAAVGRLAARVASRDAEIGRLQDLAELAAERDNKARADLAAATADQQRTAAAAVAAQRAVDAARTSARAFVRDSYLVGIAMSSYAALLSARGPTELLQQADYLRLSARHQLALLGQVNRAKVRQANADSAARAAVDARQEAGELARRARLDAVRRVAEAGTQLTALRAQKAALEGQLEHARVAANGLSAERRRYQAWQRERAAAAARQQVRQAALRHRASGSTGVWTGGRGGSWTAAKGAYVAHAALRWLGLPYAWGGGSYRGPTHGTDDPAAGWHDSTVYGFDCSGLALWSWAQVGVDLPHYSGYQYLQGSYHPSPSRLMPGDLVFWSYDGTVGGIHHVAIYLGGGQVVQAPHSGDVVRISPLRLGGYFGATRPGT